jgi:hypothetical protein
VKLKLHNKVRYYITGADPENPQGDGGRFFKVMKTMNNKTRNMKYIFILINTAIMGKQCSA